jgi:hypothetical protein
MTHTHLHTAAEVLRQSLVAAGVGVTPADNTEWSVYVGFMPDGPKVHNNVIAVYDTAGTVDGRLHTSGETIDHPGFQVRVRGTTHPVAYNKVKEVLDHLDSILREGVVLGTDSYTIQAAHRRGTPLALGPEQDKHRRHQFTVNGVMTIHDNPTTTTAPP